MGQRCQISTFDISALVAGSAATKSSRQGVDAVGTNRYSYAAFGAVASEDGPWVDDTVSYTYTTNRLRQSLNLLQPNSSAWAQTYAYEEARQLTNITSPAGDFGYAWNAAADPGPGTLISKLALPNGAYITNTFDGKARWLSTKLCNSQDSLLNSHAYVYNDAHQRTKQTRTAGDFLDYSYDNIGQLATALGKESGGSTNRWQEQFRYGYDKAGNLSNRVHNVLTNVFHVNNLNQLTSVVRTNTSLTVAGTTSSPATNVTVNTVAAIRYADRTFARTNYTLSNGTNTFTAVALDNLGRADTNVVSINLPTAVTFLYDQNGNLFCFSRKRRFGD